MQLFSADGSPIRVQGYAVVYGAQAGKLRISQTCKFVVAGEDCRFTVHHVAGVNLGSARAGTLRLWADPLGLAFEADAIADRRGIAWALQYLEAGKTGCSYLGHEITRVAADGVTEITLIDLLDVCLSDMPTFAATAAWRSDAHWRDVPGRAGAMREAHGRTSNRHDVPFSWKPSTAAGSAPRASARRLGASPRSAAAAALTVDDDEFRPRGVSLADWRRCVEMQRSGARQLARARR
jgi:phage head maturation protease